MILDQLVRLAEGKLGQRGPQDEALPRRSLVDCVKSRLNQTVKKPIGIRTGFGRLQDNWDDITYEELEYAVADARWAELLYLNLERRARELEAENHLYLYPKPVRKVFGLLSCNVQLKGAIALERIERRGIAIDQKSLDRAAAETLVIKKDAADHLRDEECLLPILKVKNRPALAERMGRYWVAGWKLNTKRTQEALVRAAGLEDPPKIASGQVSLRRADWRAHRKVPLVGAFIEYKRTEKTLGFIKKYIGRTRLYPRYRPLVRSGRTSCHGPNLQQVPRGRLRNIFVPSEGFVFCEIDYKAIELSAVAQICLNMFGESRMADLINDGVDLHHYFQRRCEERGLRIERITAKMANFGFCGGMGAKTFRQHMSEAGVDIDPTTAQDIRNEWISTYPEFLRYLKDRDPAPGEGFSYYDLEFDRIVRPGIWARQGIWLDESDTLHEPLVEFLGDRADGMPRTEIGWALLVNRTACVPTGRIRRGVTYTTQRNTPFQGLAADGAKLALDRLDYQGALNCGGYPRKYRTVAFVHDSVLLEVHADRGDYLEREEEAAHAMLGAMDRVIPDVRISVTAKGPLEYWGDESEERVYGSE
jgi:hypothetical protein